MLLFGNSILVSVVTIVPLGTESKYLWRISGSKTVVLAAAADPSIGRIVTVKGNVRRVMIPGYRPSLLEASCFACARNESTGGLTEISKPPAVVLRRAGLNGSRIT